MSNHALDTNPPSGSVQHITVRGSDWLWAVFAIMMVTDIVVFFWQFSLPRGQRVFHQLCLFILSTAAIAYFSMASDLGYASVLTEFGHMGYSANTTRQIWVMTGLVGALVVTSYKWGFYTFGCAALFYVPRASAGALGADYKSAFTSSAAILSFLWLLYPIAWGLADGGNVITPDSEMIFYGILDVLAKPVFTIYHLYRLSKLDLSLLQLSSGKFSSSGGVFDREKHAAAGAPAMVGVPGASTTGTAKGGFFSRRGQRDAVAEPRTSEATAVGS
ncbi:hypothetical protein V865_007667 [Kwoniella europaea PYCC6329]|uniref:Family A G protein-coupled receptor-like protein n=1 Tax=Kwoniella europaea PYCC6329 TaxID=1423913 RepID=A0AAX4KVC4_9TREE